MARARTARTATRTASRTAQRTAVHHRKLQRRRARADRQRPPEEAETAMQAGARPYPVPPFPRQHQRKPGLETRLDPPPMYEAPFWKGSFKLLDKVALITGGDSGIGRAVAVLFAREGADVAIVYLPVEESDAQTTRKAVEAEGRRALLIPGDVQQSEFCVDAVERTVEAFGRLDIVVNNAAYQQHQESIEDITDEQLDRTFRANITRL